MHDHCRESDPATYSHELELTRRLIDANDRAHALHHCCGALALEPNRREWIPMLRELFADERLVDSLDDNRFVGAAAARAFHLHGKGDYVEALSIIGSCAQSAPQMGYLRWYESWLGDAIRAGVAIPGSAVLTVLLLGTKFGLGRIRMSPAERAAGRVDHGLVETAVGLAQRSLGQFDRALETFRRAFSLTNDPLYIYEQMRVLADAGRWKEALARFDEVSAMTEPDRENLLERRAIALAAVKGTKPTEPPLDIVRRRALNHGVLVPMFDATANVARNLVEQLGTDGQSPTALGETLRGASLTLNVAGQEGPSARLCIASMFAGAPDPRLASYDGTTLAIRTIDDEVGQYSLWKLDDGVIVQALPEPQPAVSAWILRLALAGSDETVAEPESDFLDLWADAKKSPPPDASARDWVAATIYPEMPVFRAGMGPDWVLRWQVAALIGLAHSEPGWVGTAKRDALLSLLRHEIDWPMAAAIRVGLELALEEVESTAEIRKQLIVLSSELVGDQNAGLLHTLLLALQTLPFVGEEHTERIQKDLASRDEDQQPDDDEDADEDADDDEPAAASEPPAAQTGKKPWWKFWS